MPQVTINEIDQSRYVSVAQRAPIIALVPIISSFGPTDKAMLITSESQYNSTYGGVLPTQLVGDITRNYALNLINNGVSVLAKRITPSKQDVSTRHLADLIAHNSISTGEQGEGDDEVTTVPLTLTATAKYFGTEGNNLGVSVSSVTYKTGALQKEASVNYLITIYKINSFAQNFIASPDGIYTLDQEVTKYKAIDKLTISVNASNEDYIGHLDLLNDMLTLANLQITATDPEFAGTLASEDYEAALVELSNVLGTDKVLVLNGGNNYYLTNSDGTNCTSEQVLKQFEDTLAESANDITDNDFWGPFLDPFTTDFDFITAGGFTGLEEDTQDTTASEIHKNMLLVASIRGDAVACLDTPKNWDADLVYNYTEAFGGSDPVYSYATVHGPWCRVRDLATGNYTEMPPALIFLETIGINLRKNTEAQLWFAPAGVARAQASTVLKAHYEIGGTILNKWQNDNVARVNPIMKVLSYGYTIYGNSTTMQNLKGYSKSSLQSLGTRVLCNVIKKSIFSICVGLTFEPNDYQLWATFKTSLDAVLSKMKIDGGLADYEIIMDDSTVTDEDKNNLTVPGIVKISPTRPAEFFDIDFTITAAGVTFGTDTITTSEGE